MNLHPQVCWEPGNYMIAVPGDLLSKTTHVTGYTYKGLGMRKSWSASRKGRRPPRWSVTHLNSGHRVVALDMPTEQAFRVATEIAHLGEWDFEGLQGWKNRDPALRDKLQALLAGYGKIAFGGPNQDDDAARQIAIGRMA